MKRFKWLLSFFLLISLLNGSLGTVHADDPIPTIKPELPRQSESTALPEGDSVVATTTTLSLPPLKAVLIVGNIDGDYGTWTLSEVKNMKLAEAVLKQNGVSVSAFYPPNNDWNAIKAAAQGAHFLLYRGHGVEWNANPLVVGGFALSNGSNGYTFVSNDMIRNELKLASNAIVMLYGCYTAGSYGGEVNLTSSGAQNRVFQYADPFFDAGAGGYYANWWGDAFEKFLIYLFAGQTLGQAYQSYIDYNATTVERFTFPERADLAMWLDKDYYSGGWKYDNAFVGKSGLTLESLFATIMVPSPGPVAYLTTEPSDPRHQPVTINALGGLTFTWQASLSTPVSWGALSVTSGVSGTGTTVTLNPDGLKNGIYETTLTITTTTPGVLPNVKTVPVKLMVVDEVHRVFLPLNFR